MDQLFCTVCGHRLGADDLFCTACGARVAPTAGPGEADAVDPSPEQPVHVSPVEATAVRHRPVPPAAPVRTTARRPRRSRAAFWGWVAGAAVVVGVGSYALGTLAEQDDSGPTASPTRSGGPASEHTATTSPMPSPKASTDPQAMAQARALHSLISQSATDKQRIATAAGQLQRCDHLPQAIQTFQDAAASRDRLVEQAAGLEVGLLPGGGAAIADLSAALRAAGDADRAYVAWGESRRLVRVKVPGRHGKGRHHKPRFREVCRGGAALKAKAVRLSSASHGAKQETATAWNLVAAQFGLPTVTWTEL